MYGSNSNFLFRARSLNLTHKSKFKERALYSLFYKFSPCSYRIGEMRRITDSIERCINGRRCQVV